MRRLLGSAAARRVGLAAYTSGAVALGYAARGVDNEQSQRTLPSGWRACCESHALSPAQESLPARLSTIVGEANVERGVEQKGSRLGHGHAFAVVRPGTIREALDALQACVDADACVIPQGANTGLTGGSVPRGEEHGVDRPTVVINLSRLDKIMPIDGGQRMVCLAGAGIHSVLQKAQSVGCESHSVLGSIFLNPSTAAGVAFGSGGTQLRKGPVYTERVLYARVSDHGKVEVVDTLGLSQSSQDALFRKLESGAIEQSDVDACCALPASQQSYGDSVCECEGHAGRDVSRYNASTTGPDPNRSEGKVLILASVHDTFPKPKASRTLWLSLDALSTAQHLKREVCLSGGASDLPSSVEYMDRDSVVAVDEAGRVLCSMISWVGIGPTLKRLWDAKIAFEALPLPLAPILADWTLFTLNSLWPTALPPAVRELTSRHDHHLLVTVGDYGGGESARFDERLDAFIKKVGAGRVGVHACSAEETAKVSYFRFAAAPAFRTWCIGKGLEGVSVDYALPKAECGAPQMDSEHVALRMRYSHFGCNVVHEDIAFCPGVDAHASKMHLKHEVEAMGGKLPAEHGHGTEYNAPEATRRRWEEMDPLNVFNPGVGGLSVERRYGRPKAA